LAPLQVERRIDSADFKRIALFGSATGALVMKGFVSDRNLAPFVDKIYAYLNARGLGVAGRGRPTP